MAIATDFGLKVGKTVANSRIFLILQYLQFTHAGNGILKSFRRMSCNGLNFARSCVPWLQS